MSAKYKSTNVIIGQAPPKEKKKKTGDSRSRPPSAAKRKPPPPPKASSSEQDEDEDKGFGSGFRLPRMRATSNVDDRKSFMDEFTSTGVSARKEQTFEERLNDLTKAAMRDVKKDNKVNNPTSTKSNTNMNDGASRAQQRASINTILKEGRSMDREIEREAIRGRPGGTWTGRGASSRSPGPRGRNLQQNSSGQSAWSGQQDAANGNRTYNKHGVAAPSHTMPRGVGGGQETKDDIPTKDNSKGGYSAVNTVEDKERERKYKARFVGKKSLQYALWSHKMSYGTAFLVFILGIFFYSFREQH
jgi:hypothetical protein